MATTVYSECSATGGGSDNVLQTHRLISEKGFVVSEVQTEHVLVVPTERFHSLGYFQGFSERTDCLQELLHPEHTSYRPRDEVEEDPSFKQLIPYCVFRHLDQTGTPHLFQYTRGSGQGEGRLHAKKSIGIGGHISQVDAGASADRDPYEECLRRELEEEVLIDTPYTQQCVGLINDDETPVGKVHLGVVHLFDVEKPGITPREAEIIAAGFRPREEILEDLETFETWSQICMRALFSDLPKASIQAE